jgi:hypothetical protein
VAFSVEAYEYDGERLFAMSMQEEDQMPSRLAPSTLLASAIVLALVSTASAQTSAWNASIVSASTTEPQFISEKVWPGRAAGHRWIKLVVEFTKEGAPGGLPASQITLISDSSSDTVTAVGHQVSPRDAIVYLPMVVLPSPHPDPGTKSGPEVPKADGAWTTIYQPDSVNKNLMRPLLKGFYDKRAKSKDWSTALFFVLLQGKSGERELIATKQAPLRVSLLFAVPEGATNLQLRVGDKAAIPVPALTVDDGSD